MAKSEAAIQAEIRLAASEKGWRLFRNNVGVAVDQRGIPVRYGLANESKQMNENIKSSDLIGIRPVVIQPEHVGKVIGQFVAIEVKHEDWVEGGDAHTVAQRRFMDIINNLGGHACFVTDKEVIGGG